MAYLKCCGHLHKAEFFQLEAPVGYSSSVLKVMNYECPICKNFVVEVERTKFVGDKKTTLHIVEDKIRRINDDACDLLEKLNCSILFQIKPVATGVGGFYLNYSEHGVKKRCYSNLSTLKIGLTDNLVGVKSENPDEDKFIDLSNYKKKSLKVS